MEMGELLFREFDQQEKKEWVYGFFKNISNRGGGSVGVGGIVAGGVWAGSVGISSDEREVECRGIEDREVGDAGVSMGNGVVAGWQVVGHGETGAAADFGGWEIE
jgi:hypothetical protein